MSLYATVSRREPLLRWSLVAAGAAVGLAMVLRSQAEGDQLNLLARGWLLAAHGEWYQFGMPTSAGGLAPGGLTSLVVGLPLMLWRDFRAPALVVWLSHLIAWLLLDRTLAPALGRWGRLLLVVLYWLSPWRLYFSGFLWNANYMFFFGAVHLATAAASRERASFPASAAHVAALGLAAQLHASAPLLGLVSLLLIVTRRIRLSVAGATAGAALVALSLLPWAVAALEAPRALPGGEGFLGRGLVMVFPLLRGVAFWLRYGSLAVSGKLLRLDFTPAFGAAVDAVMAPLLIAFGWLAAAATLPLPVAAALRLWRRRRLVVRPLPAGAPGSTRRWLAGYAAACFAGAVVSFALSPTTVMMWQGFVVFHAALLPGLLLGSALLAGRWRERAARAVVAWAAVALLLGATMAVASPMYRRGGRRAIGKALAADYPILHELGLAERCSFRVVGPGGWTPDLYRSGGPGSADPPQD